MRALLIDDHRLFIDVIRSQLGRIGFDEIEVATSGGDALSREGQAPDLVLVDLGLPDQSGLVVGRELAERYPAAKVVALTALDDPMVVEEAARSGFHGYVLKDVPISWFCESIEAILAGASVFPQRLLRAKPRSTDRGAKLFTDQLTRREIQVLALLVEGATGQEVSRRLSISTNTVRTHVQSILSKLQVHSRLEAVAFAVRNGVVDVPSRRRAG